MKKVLILWLAVVLAGCASLSKTQVESVNDFAKTSQGFSDYPSSVVKLLFEIREKRGAYYAASKADPAGHVAELDSIAAEKQRDLKFTAKVDVTFKIIDKYAQALLLLSSDKHSEDLKNASEKLGVGLDSLVELYNTIDAQKQLPTGIGIAVGALITFGGKQYIRSKQAKEIKKFVEKADPLIQVMTDNLIEFLSQTKIETLIANEETGLSESYKFYVARCTSLGKTPSMEDEREYLDMKEDIKKVRELRQKTIESTRQLRKAHAKLLEVVKEKRQLKEVLADLTSLYEEVKEVKSIIEEIKK